MQTEVDSRDEHSTDYFLTRQSYFSPQSENNLSRSVSSHSPASDSGQLLHQCGERLSGESSVFFFFVLNTFF